MTRVPTLLRSCLVASGYLLAATLLAALEQRHLVDPAIGQRLMGMLMGTVVIVGANAIPKRLVPLDSLACEPAREQRLRRFCGWVLVLGGLGYTLAYALAPIDVAAMLAISLLAPAFVIVSAITLRCAWRRRGAQQAGDAS